MTTELWMLFWTVILALGQIGLTSTVAKLQTGIPYSIGPRDEDVPLTGLAGRLDRAQRNFYETFPLFAAAVVLVHLSGTSGYWSELGAQVYFWGRLAYIPAYAAGIPWFRTILWSRCWSRLG